MWGGRSWNTLILLLIVHSIVGASNTLLCFGVIQRSCWGAQSNIVRFNAFGYVVGVDDLWLSAGRALVGGSVEARSQRIAVNLDAGLLSRIQVAAIIAGITFAASSVEQFSFWEDAELTSEWAIYKLLLPQALIASATLHVEDLVGLASIAFLAAQIEDAALGAIEASLFLISHKRILKGAIGEVIAGWPLEDIYFVVTGRSRAIVPIFGIQVIFKIAIIQVDDSGGLLRFNLVCFAVPSI